MLIKVVRVIESGDGELYKRDDTPIASLEVGE